MSHASVFAKRLERLQRCCRCDCSHRPAHDCRDASDVFVEGGLGMRPTSLPRRLRGSHHRLFSISKLDSAGWHGAYIFFSELGQSREREEHPSQADMTDGGREQRGSQLSESGKTGSGV